MAMDYIRITDRLANTYQDLFNKVLGEVTYAARSKNETVSAKILNEILGESLDKYKEITKDIKKSNDTY